MYDYYRDWPEHSGAGSDEELVQAEAFQAGVNRGDLTGLGLLTNIFDSEFNGAARSEFYRAQLVPELFPHEKRMMLENWPADDLEMYCGIYSNDRRAELMVAA